MIIKPYSMNKRNEKYGAKYTDAFRQLRHAAHVMPSKDCNGLYINL